MLPAGAAGAAGAARARPRRCAAAPPCPTRRCACPTCSTAWSRTARSARARSPAGASWWSRRSLAPSHGSSTWTGARRARRTASCWSARADPSRGRRRWRRCAAPWTAGVSADADVEMPGYAAPIVPADAAARAEVGQLDYNPARGPLHRRAVGDGAGMAPAHARLSGRVVEMVELPVAAHRMMPGDVIGRRTSRWHGCAPADPGRRGAGAGAGDRHGAAPPGRARGAAAAGRSGPAVHGSERRAVQMQLETPGISLRRRGWRWIAARWGSGCAC